MLLYPTLLGDVPPDSLSWGTCECILDDLSGCEPDQLVNGVPVHEWIPIFEECVRFFKDRDAAREAKA